MAKKKQEDAFNLENILFKCRDILRQARNSGSFFEKRDMMLTLIFLRFIGEKFEDGIEKLRQQLIPMIPRSRQLSLMMRPLPMACTSSLYPMSTRPPFSRTSNPQQHPQPKYAVILIVSVSQKGSGLVCKYSKNATRVE